MTSGPTCIGPIGPPIAGDEDTGSDDLMLNFVRLAAAAVSISAGAHRPCARAATGALAVRARSRSGSKELTLALSCMACTRR